MKSNSFKMLLFNFFRNNYIIGFHPALHETMEVSKLLL